MLFWRVGRTLRNLPVTTSGVEPRVVLVGFDGQLVRIPREETQRQPKIGYQLASRYPNLFVACCGFENGGLCQLCRSFRIPFSCKKCGHRSLGSSTFQFVAERRARRPSWQRWQTPWQIGGCWATGSLIEQSCRLSSTLGLVAALQAHPCL